MSAVTWQRQVEARRSGVAQRGWACEEIEIVHLSKYSRWAAASVATAVAMGTSSMGVSIVILTAAEVSCLEKTVDPTLSSSEPLSASHLSSVPLPTSGSHRVYPLSFLSCCCRLDSDACGWRRLEVR
jgi:hypothetical protein